MHACKSGICVRMWPLQAAICWSSDSNFNVHVSLRRHDNTPTRSQGHTSSVHQVSALICTVCMCRPEPVVSRGQQGGLQGSMMARRIASSGDSMAASSSGQAAGLPQQPHTPADAHRAARSSSRFQEVDHQVQDRRPADGQGDPFNFAEPFFDGNDMQESNTAGQALQNAKADGDAPVRASLSLLDL